MNLIQLGIKSTIFLFLFCFSLSINAQLPPDRAFEHRETIRHELDRLFDQIPTYNYIPALIEHESCITLRHSRCWSPTSEFRTPREQGVGLGQITRAWRSNGTLRFDNLAEMRKRHPSELDELSWDTITQRSDLQIRAIVLQIRDNYRILEDVKDPINRLHMVDAAYNGGMGHLRQERRLCSLTAGCDPQYWFGHVERTCVKSKVALYGNRSACDINRHHVRDIFESRLPRYEEHYFIVEEEPIEEPVGVSNIEEEYNDFLAKLRTWCLGIFCTN